MRNLSAITIAFGVAFILCAIWAADSSANPPARGGAASLPADGTSMIVPDAVIEQIQGLYKNLPQGMNETEMHKIIAERAKKILEVGAKAEKDYPLAPNLAVVRLGMIGAAEFLAPNDESAAAELVEVAGRLLTSPAPEVAKLRADVILTRVRLAKIADPAEIAKEVNALADRYAKGDQAGVALLQAAMLATAAKQTQLLDSLVEKIKTGGYLQQPDMRNFLVKIRKLPFTAELTTLEGKKIKLPDDTKGKVVVLCFWAQGGAACHTIIDQMKELYPSYKPQGVEFVGIALDAPADADKVKKFVADRKLEWIQTFSAQATDPTAAEYRVRAIPTIWILGRDGLVMCVNGHDDLPKFLDGAVKYCDSQPAGAASQPSSTPAMTK